VGSAENDAVSEQLFPFDGRLPILYGMTVEKGGVKTTGGPPQVFEIVRLPLLGGAKTVTFPETE
jgi:hypothetical protein